MTTIHLIAVDDRDFRESICQLLQEVKCRAILHHHYSDFDPTKADPQDFYVLGSGYWDAPEKGPEYVCPVLQARVPKSHIITGRCPEHQTGVRRAAVAVPGHPLTLGSGLGDIVFQDGNGNVPILSKMIESGLDVMGYPGHEIAVVDYIKNVMQSK